MTLILIQSTDSQADVTTETDRLDDLSPEFISDLELAANDNDLNDAVSNEEAFKMFRQWAQA